MTAGKQTEFVGVRGAIRCQESMAKHTSWKVGGPARYFFEPKDLDDLTAFLQSLDSQVPILWLGLGSNFAGSRWWLRWRSYRGSSRTSGNEIPRGGTSDG